LYGSDDAPVGAEVRDHLPLLYRIRGGDSRFIWRDRRRGNYRGDPYPAMIEDRRNHIAVYYYSNNGQKNVKSRKDMHMMVQKMTNQTTPDDYLHTSRQ
jgi:hypothetical protein